MREFKLRHWCQLMLAVALIVANMPVLGTTVAGLTLFDWVSGYD